METSDIDTDLSKMRIYALLILVHKTRYLDTQ